MSNFPSQNKRKIRVGTNHVLAAAFVLVIAFVSSFLRLLTLSSIHDGSSSAAAENTNSAIGAPGIQQLDTSAISTKSKRPNSFHFVISSDCTSYQRWEVLVQLHSAQSIRQCGRYTWIVSGCLEEGDGAEAGKGKGGAHSDKLTPSLLLEEVGRHFPVTLSNHTVAKEAIGAKDDNDCHTIHPHLHFTPDFTNMSVYGGPFADGTRKRTFKGRNGKIQQGNYGNTYPFNNKPNGLNHWAQHFLRNDERRDESIVLIDPDFLFLNKFELDEIVLPGKPAAAKYGLGWSGIPCPFISVTNKDVNNFYSAGPPYVIHIEDVLKFSKRWSDLVPPTFDEYPLLYAEMFAYSMAAADLGLKHKLVKNIFSGCMTGWPHTHEKEELNALKLSAKTYADLIENAPLGLEATGGGASSCFLSPLSPPPFLHYCARYSFVTPFSNSDGDNSNVYHWFAKRHVDHDILDCGEHPQPLQPFLSNQHERGEGGDKDWNVLAVCAIVRAINYAKRMGCEKDAMNH
ncbi:hypothetical protein HJC23_006765 [Cyclotella cryptica]|uniref:Uncharacterized protein n=1 Tax=Cyclotella cryptica TaxID=29204 RepID=A0ABD3NMP7_9STRA|eukprot:CCRYP_020631-RC/>CCRYP_020631-RC protein AED:0.37 eAED:0.37 QI:164/0.75/0.8/1/0.5/0.4/5/285/511